MTNPEPVTEVADYLATLPAGVRDPLVRIARLILDSTDDEKRAARLLTSVIAMQAISGDADDLLPGAQMISALGVAITHAQALSAPATTTGA
ncbi:hypothetical protein ENKNEFLB_01948 [Nocardioides aquaticus]|uniref:Uncharacterized protein n=1 Tax=Nocardioides aquaticus TaxID=160826 RepID=A0ABX8EI51_9ACTN|nr:hypothetical protein [Nocardioides aquaticus]QVT79565.1 hypothetical protein ENKNEFLB_01948 [Nocardioides aquaticus]